MDLESLGIGKELQLILYCTNLELDTTERENLRNLVSLGHDWEHLLELSTYHRLVPLVYANLKNNCEDIIPNHVLRIFESSRDGSVRRNLAQAGELKNLITELHLSDIDVALIKGHSLKKELYGKSSLRESFDIDILVRQADVIQVSNILLRLGFRAEDMDPDFDMDSTIGKHLVRKRNEQHYYSIRSEVSIDLHWRLSQTIHAFPVQMEKIWNHMEKIETEYGVVHHLTDSINFIYLCYHGSKHHWFRLHWLCDIVLLIERKELNWDDILSQAKQLGVLPTIALAVMLGNIVLKMPVPAALIGKTDFLRLGETLAMRIAPVIISSRIESELLFLLSRLFSSWQLQTIWTHRFLTWTYLLSPSNKDYRLLKLPGALSFLYYPITLARLSIRVLIGIWQLLAKRTVTKNEIVGN